MMKLTQRLYILLLLKCVVLPSGGDMCDWRDKRDFRKWKGDAGDLETFPGGIVRDRLVLHHRRIRRFLSFPTGSVLTITPQLTIPWVSELDSTITSNQVYKFAFDLLLPNSTLRLSKFNKDDSAETMHDGYGSKFDDWYSTYYTDEYGSSSSYAHGYEQSSSYAEGYKDLHYNQDRYRGRRSLDDQRLKGFHFLEKLLENLGIDGHQCLLRVVCEIGEEPINDMGLTGEIINLFFSAGYGSRIDELSDYILAEESGRQQGDCESQYPACPYQLMTMIESAFTHFHQGLSQVGLSQGNSLLI